MLNSFEVTATCCSHADRCCLDAEGLVGGVVAMHTEITLLHLFWTFVQDIKLNTRKMLDCILYLTYYL